VPDHIGVRIVKVSGRSGDPVDPEDPTGAKEKLRDVSTLNQHRITLHNVEVELQIFGQRKKVTIPSLTLEGDPADWPAQIVRQVPELQQLVELYARIREARTNPALAKKLAQWLKTNPGAKALREAIRERSAATNH
jgi:predicted component of type VI protein secretion system